MPPTPLVLGRKSAKGGSALGLNSFSIDQRFFDVPSDLAGCFTAITRIDCEMPAGQTISDHMQPEWASIRFFTRPPQIVTAPDGKELANTRAIACGASTAPTPYRWSGGRLWGIGLLPLGWSRFMRGNSAALANTAVDAEMHPAWKRFAPLAESLFGPEPDDAAEFQRIIAHLGRIVRPHRDPERVLAMHRVLLDPATANVADFAGRAGLTKRTLERLSLKHFGFSPAKLLRRQRLMRSLMDFTLSPDRNWSEVIDGRYHDQAHFVREFQHFMGMSPREYAAMDSPILNALIQLRVAQKGAATPTLERPQS